MQQKALVYFTIGGAPEYAELLRCCLVSMWRCPENRALVDVLVMCDEAYARTPQLASILAEPGLVQHLQLTPPNETPVHASMRKCEVFSFPHTDSYSAVLYLDCDIVVNGSLRPVLEAVLAARPERIHVVHEALCPGAKDFATMHTWSFFCRTDAPFDAETLGRLARNDTRPFNAGQFAFRPGPQMRAHFEAIARRIAETYDPAVHFYEQSFMNDHFNGMDPVPTTPLPGCRLFYLGRMGGREPRVEEAAVLNHFCESTLHHSVKLGLMRRFDAALATSGSGVTTITTGATTTEADRSAKRPRIL